MLPLVWQAKPGCVKRPDLAHLHFSGACMYRIGAFFRPFMGNP